MSKLYALLVGVNRYPALPASKQLQAAVADAQQIEGYLQEPYVQAAFDRVEVQTLFDTDATKEAIVDGLRKHLGQAQVGDTALFYFSGHGIRETSDLESFAEDEIDAAIGGIVCTDIKARQTPDLTVLSDKEFRFLIRDLYGDQNRPHVMLLFDCCHSGDNTRDILGGGDDNGGMRSRQLERGTLPARSWEGFIFHQDRSLKARVDQGAPLEAILPQADHVMMAACREIELAWEGDGKGAFTTALVDVLKQHQGRISYHELQSRVLGRMRFNFNEEGKDKRQTPQFYLHAPKVSDRYNLFLTNQPNEQPSYAAVEHAPGDNRASKVYRLALGALHGVPLKGKTPVQVYPMGRENEAVEGSVAEVFPTYSVLAMPQGFGMAADTAYQGKIKGLGITPIKVAVAGQAQGAQDVQKALKAYLAKTDNDPFQIVAEESQADYVVWVEADKWLLSPAGDKDRPVVQPYGAQGASLEGAEILAAELAHIGRWCFLRDLNYSEQLMPESLKGQATMYPVELRMYRYDPDTEQETRVQPKGNTFTFEFSQEEPDLQVRFELVNHAPQPLQASLIYMPHTFSFGSSEKTRMMQQLQPLLEQGDTLASRGRKQANGKSYIRLNVDAAYLKAFNWPATLDHLKLVVSATPFDLVPFALDDLPEPKSEARDLRDSTRGFDFGEEEKLPEVAWELRTFDIVLNHPYYQPA